MKELDCGIFLFSYDFILIHIKTLPIGRVFYIISPILKGVIGDMLFV